jgi:hypothetical protein
MRREILYRALLSRFDPTEAETIVDEVASLNDQNIDRLKDIFATKEDLHKELRNLYNDLSNKIDKIYWFILGQTAIMVGLILAILRMVNIF